MPIDGTKFESQLLQFSVLHETTILKTTSLLIFVALFTACNRNVVVTDEAKKVDEIARPAWNKTRIIAEENFELMVPVNWEDNSHTWMGCLFCPEYAFFTNGVGLPHDYRGKRIVGTATVLKHEGFRNLQQAKRAMLKRLPKSSKEKSRQELRLSDGSKAVMISIGIDVQNRKRSYYGSKYLFITHSEKDNTTCILTLNITHADERAYREDANLMPYAQYFFQSFSWK